MKVLLSDEVFDSQLLRAVGHMYEGGADYGECYSTATRIRAHDTESWHREWNATAVRIEMIARDALERGHRQSAQEAFLRAAMYHRASGQFFLGDPTETRSVAAFQKCESCFQEAMKLAPNIKCESIRIPYKDEKYFPAHFLASASAEKKGSTVIVNGGYDSNKEELYFFSGAAALRRGYNVLLFDGPGQGLTLLEQKVATIPDWENVITPIIDYLHTRDDVDKSKIVALGISFGGYQVPRAATKEKRLAAIIADPGQINVGKKARMRLPLPASWRASFPKNIPWLVVSLLSSILNWRANDPTFGWTMRRIKHVHGLQDLTEIFPELDRFALDPNEITTPIFISFAEKDDIAIESQELYDRVKSEKKKFVRYTEDSGSAEHCETANRSTFNADAFNWLDELLF